MAFITFSSQRLSLLAAVLAVWLSGSSQNNLCNALRPSFLTRRRQKTAPAVSPQTPSSPTASGPLHSSIPLDQDDFMLLSSTPVDVAAAAPAPTTTSQPASSSAAASSLPNRRMQVRQVDLPRHTDTAATAMRNLMLAAELSIGRAAMLAAVVLAVAEVCTGESFLDLIARLTAMQQ